MCPVVRLNEDNLILMVEIQGSAFVFLDGEVEHRRSGLHERVQVVVITVLSSYELRSPEAELWRAATRDED